MSSWRAELKRREAAQRREEREAKKRQRELERRLKECLKLSELEQSRLEVEQYENTIEVLLSVQKDCSPPMDWVAFVSALPPLAPPVFGSCEFAETLSQSITWHSRSAEETADLIRDARLRDQQEQALAFTAYEGEYAQWQRMRSLALRVIEGDIVAYRESVHEFSALGEISSIGSSISLHFHGAKLVDCKLQVKGRDVIPGETKSLTAAGKLSSKAISKVRFHEIYQDYVCGCALRLAREMFALLPLDTVLVAADVDEVNGSGGGLAVLSVVFNREQIEKLDFAHLDASDTIEGFIHRGDAKASRKSGEFVPIIPLTPADLVVDQSKLKNFGELLTAARQLRDNIAASKNSEGTRAQFSFEPWESIA